MTVNTSTIHFHLITPCFSSGANQEKAEIRGPSIRGQLRWWFRALGGTAEEEQSIFGTIHGGRDGKEPRSSSVRVRVSHVQGPRKDNQNLDDMGIKLREFQGYFLWPLRKNRRGRYYPRGKTFPSFTLNLNHRPLVGGKELPRQTLLAFALLGTLGSRSRRGYGSLWPQSITFNGEDVPIPQTLEELQGLLEEILPKDFTVLALVREPGKTWDEDEALNICAESLRAFRCHKASQWGKDDHDVPYSQDSTQVYRPALGLPLTQRYRNGKTFKTSKPGVNRWASPLLFKIVRLQQGFMPLGIFCNHMVMKKDTLLSVEGREGEAREVRLSLDLWEAMQDPGRVSAILERSHGGRFFGKNRVLCKRLY